MIRWFAKNDIATNLLMLGILFVGFFVALPSMPVEIDPAYPYKEVHVRFNARGMAAEDIERKIVTPFETSLLGAPGVKQTYARIWFGNAYLQIDANASADLQELKADIESRLNRISTLPSELAKPRVYIPDTTRRHEVISILVSGNLTPDELLKAGRQVRDDLMATPEISNAEVQGGKKRQIYIEPNLNSLRTHGLQIADLSLAVRNSSIELTAGKITAGSQSIPIITKNQALTTQDFENIIIKVSDGAELRVKDVAKVVDSYSDERKIFLFNGKPCTRVEVTRLKHESAITVADAVHGYLEKSKYKFPAGIELSTWNDDSTSLRSRIRILKENLTQGAMLVLITLALFLRPSLAIFVVLGVPVSFAGAISLMWLFDVSINVWTIFGFIIVLGIVVDDAIVTAENIHSRLGKFASRLQAVVEGTKEVATPVTFGVLTTIVAFIPLLFFEGEHGHITKQIPFVIIPVLIFSLIESKFILPGHLKHDYSFLNRVNPFPFIHRRIDAVMSFIVESIYSPALKFCMIFRHAVVFGFFTILVVTIGYLKSPSFKFEEMPEVDRYIISGYIQMDAGTELEETHKAVERITESVNELREHFPDGNTGKSLIGKVFTSSGGYSWGGIRPTRGVVSMEITPTDFRDPNTPPEKMTKNQEIAAKWRQILGKKPGVKFFKIRYTKRSRHNSEQSPIDLRFSGPDEENKALVVQQLEDWMNDQEWIGLASASIEHKAQELNVNLNTNGETMGLTNNSLARQLRSRMFGETAQRFQHGEDEIRVDVRLPNELRKSAATLNELRIKTDNGETSLKSVADISVGAAPPSITRINGSRILTLSSTIDEGEKGNLIHHLKSLEQKVEELCAANPGVTWQFTGKIAEQRAAKKRFNLLAILLAALLFGLLAIPFKSVIQPIFVLMAVPLGVVGALLGHHHMNITVSFLSILGLLALSGVVVNDSLVIVDFINKKRLEGKNLQMAIHESGKRRFRPILLTSVTTFAGLYPIMHEKSIEAKFLIPMAISLGYGILFATAITLILIPCAYMVAEDIKASLRWFFLGKFEHKGPKTED